MFAGKTVEAPIRPCPVESGCIRTRLARDWPELSRRLEHATRDNAPMFLTTLALLAAVALPSGITASHYCSTEQIANGGPHVESVRAGSISCHRAIDGRIQGSVGPVAPCLSVVDCLDNFQTILDASDGAAPTFPTLPVGKVHTFPPYRFRVTAHRIKFRKGPPYVVERWACGAVFRVVPTSAPAWDEWVDVTCYRGRASVAVKLVD
jgi:hypothetical protein